MKPKSSLVGANFVKKFDLCQPVGKAFEIFVPLQETKNAQENRRQLKATDRNRNGGQRSDSSEITSLTLLLLAEVRRSLQAEISVKTMQTLNANFVGKR